MLGVPHTSLWKKLAEETAAESVESEHEKLKASQFVKEKAELTRKASARYVESVGFDAASIARRVLSSTLEIDRVIVYSSNNMLKNGGLHRCKGAEFRCLPNS